MNNLEKRRAFLYVADWVESRLAEGSLEWYYWGYEDVANHLRGVADEFYD